MPTEIKNLDVHLISLVGKAANGKTIIYKSKEGKNLDNIRTFEIKKYDEEKGLVYGIVYEPNVSDTDDEFMTQSEIRKAMEAFMKKSATGSIDVNHNLVIHKDCTIVESWEVRKGDALFPDSEGAWAICVKVENDEIKEQIKKGELTGFSMYGFATKVGDAEIEKSFFQHVKKFFTGDEAVVMKSEFDDRLKKINMRTTIDAFASLLYDIVWDDYLSLEEKKKRILSMTDEFKAKLEEVELVKSEVMKAGKMISDANLKKLNAAMESINAIIEAATSATEKREKINQKGDTEVDTTEIKKMIDEAVKPIQDSNEALKKENTDLKAKIEKLEKDSKPSTQSPDVHTEEVKKGRPAFSVLGLY